jgi:hypothetical protein
MRAIIGSEILAAGILTRGQLRARYDRVLTDVYLPRDCEPTIVDYAESAWLWSGRTGIISGIAAAALYGVTWVDAGVPIEVLTRRRSSDPRLITRSERHHDDEVRTLQSGVLITSPARTALDLARHHPRIVAVKHLDGLAAVTGVSLIEIAALTQRYRGVANIRECWDPLRLMDGGAKSPRESELRVAMVDAGLPKPAAQIWVDNAGRSAIVPLGWEQQRIGLTPADLLDARNQLRRSNILQLLNWITLFVPADEKPATTAYWAREAFHVQRCRGLF